MERPDLTTRQREVLDLFRTTSPPPTVREMAEALGITSVNGVVCHLKALVRKGYLRRVFGARGRNSYEVVDGPSADELRAILSLEDLNGETVEIRGEWYLLTKIPDPSEPYTVTIRREDERPPVEIDILGGM